tara:strand:+ start:6501 stop:7394 length:894 start_codon:yes stop_codon:yes gene_type:complete
MSNFNFKGILKENLYIHNYPYNDKVKIVLNEGQTLMLEKEIHEGIMDLLKGYTKKQPGWEKELAKQIDAWLAKSKGNLSQKMRIRARNNYLKNLNTLQVTDFYKDGAALSDVEDSLEALEDGDLKTAASELEAATDKAGGGAVDDIGDPDEAPTEEIPKPQGRKRKRVRDRSNMKSSDDVRIPQQTVSDKEKDAKNIEIAKGLAGPPRAKTDVAAASIRQALQGASSKRLKILIRKALIDKGISPQKSDEIFPVIFDLMKRSAEEMKGKQIKVDEIKKLKKSIRKIIKEATQNENKK